MTLILPIYLTGKIARLKKKQEVNYLEEGRNPEFSFRHAEI
jgi:hypothetical protein